MFIKSLARINSKQDIANMLETAGFSKSNPYYIVEQGKVTKITEMSDKARLELLKEVAGTNVYEEKKDESLKIVSLPRVDLNFAILDAYSFLL